MLIEELAEAGLDGTRRQYLEQIERVPLLILDDLGVRELQAMPLSQSSRSCARIG